MTGFTAAVTVASRLGLAIRLSFHNHTPQQLSVGLAFHQQGADEAGRNLLSGAGEEALGEGWEVVNGVGSGLWRCAERC